MRNSLMSIFNVTIIVFSSVWTWSCSNTVEFGAPSRQMSKSNKKDPSSANAVTVEASCDVTVIGSDQIKSGSSATIRVVSAMLDGAELKGTDGSVHRISPSGDETVSLTVAPTRDVSYSVEFPPNVKNPPFCPSVAIYVESTKPVAPSCGISLSPSSPRVGEKFKLEILIKDAPVSKAKIDNEWIMTTREPNERYSMERTAQSSQEVNVTVFGADQIATGSCKALVSVLPAISPTQSISILSTATVFPTDVVFVFDNSQSMADKINRLKTSMASFAAQLSAASVKYNAHIVPVSEIGNILDDRSSFYLISRALMPQISFFPWMMANVTASNQSQVDRQIAAMTLAKLESESGIASAWAYSRGNSLTKEAGGQIHYLVLSDEDNARKWDVVNGNTGALVTSKPMFMESNSSCTSYTSRDVLEYTKCSWDRLDYTATQPETVEFAYSQPGRCQIEQDSSSSSIGVTNVIGTKDCSEKVYSCELSNQPESYSCSAQGYAARTLSINVQGQYACQMVKYADCVTYVDGQLVTIKTDGYDAKQRVKNGGSCTARWSDGTNELFVADDINSFVYRSCQPISCSVSSYVKEDVTQRVIDYDAKNRRILANCTDTGRTANGVFSRTFGYFPTQQPYSTTNSKITYTGQCTGGSVITKDITIGSYCDGSPILQSLPAEAKSVASTPSTNAIRGFFSQSHMVNGRYVSAPLTTSSADTSKVQTLVNQAYGCTKCVPPIETKVNPGTSYPAFVVAQPGQTPSSLSGKAITRSARSSVPVDSPLLGEIGGKNSYQSTNYCIKEVVRTDRVCSAYDTINLAPTPENFNAFTTKNFPNVSVKWHSIVSLDGVKCANASASDPVPQKGTDYLNLTGLTNGVSASICDDKFDKILTDISNKITENTQYSYTLTRPAAIIQSVKNETSGKILKVGSDYSVNGNKITFDSTSVAKNDQITITYAP